MKWFNHLLMVLACCPAACIAEAIRLVDDAGHEVRLAEPAQRIVSLAPHTTELLFAAGAGDKVVGVSEFSNWPQRAERLPRIGGGAGLDLEAIIALQPDLVVAWQTGNSRVQLQRLEAFGLRVFYSEPSGIDALARTLQQLGRLAGTEAVADQAAQAFRQGVAALRADYAGRKAVTVFYQIWEQPLMTVNGRHMISHWMRLCGGENVFAGLADLAAVLDEEAVLEADPQMFVAGYYPGKGESWRRRWQRWPQLRAVSGGHLYTVPAETMERHTPRALEAARELCATIERVRTSDAH